MRTSIILLLCLLGAPPVQAKTKLFTSRSAEEARADAPKWSVELRFGPYRPKLTGDNQPGNYTNSDHYKKTFKKGRKDATIGNRPLMKALEVERFLWNEFGLAGVGFRVGHWRIEGEAIQCTRNSDQALDDCDTARIGVDLTTQASETPVSLTIVPLGASALYRFDYGWRRFGIPLMPYVKVGLDYHFWWMRVDGKISKRPSNNDEKEKGRGGTLGYNAAIGVQLNLDWLDPSVRHTSATGLMGSHAFIEMMEVKANGLGSSNRLDLSHRLISVGLALDFK